MTATFVESTDGTDYAVGFKLGSLMGLADFHPFRGRFRLSAGVLAGRHRFEVTAKDAERYDVGGRSYARAELGSLSGRASVRRVAPYAGIGWGNPVGKKRLGVSIDLGVLPQGAPEVSLSATGPASSEPGFGDQLARETLDLRERLRAFRVYPVLSMGLTLKLR